MPGAQGVARAQQRKKKGKESKAVYRVERQFSLVQVKPASAVGMVQAPRPQSAGPA